MLLLVRHGQTAANAAGQLLGRAGVPLTETGLEQAAALAAALGPVERVISSPLQRARQTAAVFGSHVDVDDRWTELDYGIYDELPLADVPMELWERWRADPEYAPPEGESLASVGRRVQSACDELAPAAADTCCDLVQSVAPAQATAADASCPLHASGSSGSTTPLPPLRTPARCGHDLSIDRAGLVKTVATAAPNLTPAIVTSPASIDAAVFTSRLFAAPPAAPPHRGSRPDVLRI